MTERDVPGAGAGAAAELVSRRPISRFLVPVVGWVVFLSVTIAIAAEELDMMLAGTERRE